MRPRSVLLLVLLSAYVLPISKIYSQSPGKHFLNDYIEACVERRDSTASLKRLNTYYGKLKSSQEKQMFLNEVYETIYAFQKEQKNVPTLPAIDVYLTFAGDNDKNLPVLYYIKGEICALDYLDSIKLKDCISDLMLLNQTPKVHEYLGTLQGYLTYMRNYIPIYDRMPEGWYISTNIATYEGLPYFVMCKNSANNILLLGDAGNFVGLNNRVPRNLKDLKRDCAYLAWSNEELKAPGVIEVAFNNAVANELGSRAGYAIGNAFGSSFAGNIAGNVFAAGLNQLFQRKPSKNVEVIESQMHLCNLNEIEMINHVQALKATQGEAVKHELDTVYNDLLIRFPFADCVARRIFFMDNGKNPFLYTQFAPTLVSKDEIKQEKEYFKKGGDFYEVYENYKNLVNKNNALMAFNRLSTAKCFNIIEEYINEGGSEKSEVYHSSRNRNYIGASFEGPYDLKIKKVHEGGTAKLYGLKKGDTIVGIFGRPVSSVNDFETQLQEYEPFSMITLQITRKDKLMDIPVELGYQINTK